VASKGAALALLARVTLVLSGLDPLTSPLEHPTWIGVARILIPALAFFAALTATFGNLAAYVQTNLKRLLAYSTIAHAGYMMMGLATLTQQGVNAVLFYLVAYLVMNLGAFAVVAFLRNETGTEDLDDYRGLVRRSPWMVVTLCFFLLSLLGIPPLIGFAAKFELFVALYKGGEEYARMGEPGLGATLFGLFAVGAFNTVLSAVYYVRVMKVMILDRRAEDLEGREPVRYPEPGPSVFYAVVMALLVFGLGLAWNPLDRVSRTGAQRYLAAATRKPGPMRPRPVPVGSGGARPPARPPAGGDQRPPR
jgi:NADH-quinone oxidoreductase subunit N